MERILVVQLERLGDLVQTTPLLQDLIRMHPQCLIELMVLDGNQVVLEGMGNMGMIYAFPEQTVVELNTEVKECFRQKITPARSAGVLADLELPYYDLVINLTHDGFGCWITSRIKAGSHDGGMITESGEWLYVGPWQIYLVSLLDFRPENHFNLVDMYRGSCVGSRPPVSGSRPYCRQVDHPGVVLPEGRIIALNPGSANPARRWPAIGYAELAGRLAGQGLIPVLVGAPADRQVCSEVADQCPVPLLNFSGQTSVPQMARLLASVSLLVSNDTGAVHLAAAVGTPVVGLYGGQAFFRETSPWGEGHLILQSPLGQESLAEISSEVVFQAVLERLGLITRVDLQVMLDSASIPAWETFFLPDLVDPLGGISYCPVHSVEIRTEGLFCEVLRHCLAADLCGAVSVPQLDYLALLGEHGGLSIEICPAEVKSFIEILNSLFIRPLTDMAEAAAAMVRLLPEPDEQALKEISETAVLLESQLAMLEQDAAEFTWAKPVVSYLRWKIRLLPPLAALQLFEAHEQAYRSALVVLSSCAASAFSGPAV